MIRDPSNRPAAVDAMQDTWIQDCRSSLTDVDVDLTRKILRSLEGYAHAPRLEKVCLLLMAARLDATRLTPIRHIFDALDQDGAGTLHEEDVQEAVNFASSGCFSNVMDVSEIFHALDLNDDQELEYSEFVAGCLHSDLHSYTGHEIASLAFDALDEDGDGVVTPEELQRFFHNPNQKNRKIIQSLPQRPFDAEEFYNCLNKQRRRSSSVKNVLAMPPVQKHGSTKRNGNHEWSLMGMLSFSTCALGCSVYEDEDDDFLGLCPVEDVILIDGDDDFTNLCSGTQNSVQL